MNLSCLPVSLYPDFASGRVTLADWFRRAARLGLDGADISVAHVGSRASASLEALRRAAADAGVQIPILVTYSDFTHPDARYRTRQIEDVREWIAASHRLGVSFLRVTAGQAHPGVSEEDGLRWAVDGLTACLEDAQAAGVRLLYENHTRGSIWQYNDFTHAAARFLEVVRRTAGTSLKILFDTANCLVLDEDPCLVLEPILPRLGAVHISDIRERGRFGPTTIGTGVAPIGALLERVVLSGFDGWVSIEEAGGTGDRGFEAAVAFADRAWIEAGGRPRRRSGPLPAQRSHA